MAHDPYIERAKQILRGYGVGENPVLVRTAAAATVTVAASSPIATFILFAGEGAKVAAGDVLGSYAEGTEADQRQFKVLSVATDTVTAVHGYGGAPESVNSEVIMDDVVLELHGDGSPTEFEILRAVDIVFGTLLWPHIYDYDVATLTPNISTQRAEVPALVEKIDDMWQVIGTELIAIPYGLKKNQETTTISTTGSFVFTDAVNGSTVYYNYRSRFTRSDSATTTHLVELAAMGAAAILSGWSRPETTLASARQDSQFRGQSPDVGATLWRDFLALRDQWADDLARTGARRIIVDRG